MHSPADAVIHPYCALEEQKFVTKLSQKRTTEFFHHHWAKLLLLYTLCYIRYYTGPLHPKKHNKLTMIWISEFCPKIMVYFKGQFWNCYVICNDYKTCPADIHYDQICQLLGKAVSIKVIIDKSCGEVSLFRECIRNLDLRVQVHPVELWVSEQLVHIVLEASKSACGKGDVPKIWGFVNLLHPC